MPQGINSRIIILCFLATLGHSAGAEVLRQHTYVETTGTVESSHTVTLRQIGEGIETRWMTPEKTFVNLGDKAGNTLEWQVRYAGVDIIAQRTGNLIQLSGTRNGDSFREDLEIHESPWFQPLSYALGQSNQDAVVFWTIQPDNLDVVKLTERALVSTRNWREKKPRPRVGRVYRKHSRPSGNVRNATASAANRAF